MTGIGRIAVALSLLAGMWPGSVAAQPAKAGVVTTLEGNVTAVRTTAAQPVALKFKDDVFVNDRVVTGDRSLARLLLGGKAVVTVRERSALTITEVPGRSTIDLDSGKVAVAVAKDKMRPGEQIEVKSPNAVAAVRGTVFVVEVIRASASADNAQGGVTTNHYVFTGSIALTVGSQVVNVAANSFATVTGGVVNSGIMSAAMRATASAGLTPSGLPKVAGAEADAKQTVMSSTIATFTSATVPYTTPPPVPTTPPATPLPTPFPGSNKSGPTTEQQTFIENTTVTPPGGTLPPVTPPPVTPPPVLPPVPPPSGPPVSANGILLLGDADIDDPILRSRAALASNLRALQPNVVITNLNGPTVPADLSAYGSIWWVGAFSAISAGDQARLAQFVASGGGLYLTGEQQGRCPGCAALNSSVQSLLRVLVAGGGDIVVGSMNDLTSVPAATFNLTARGGITTAPNSLSTVFPNGPGELFGLSGANILATIGERIVAAVWDSTDLVGDAGRIILMMDVNWLSDQTSLAGCNAVCLQNIIDNFLTFLGEPAGPLALTAPLFRSVNETLATRDSFFDLPGMTISSTSLDPMFWFSGSTLTTRGVFSRMTGSTIVTGGSFLRLDSGARLIQTGTDPLVSMSAGILAVGAGSAGGNLFDLVGRASSTQVDPDTGLTVGADRPIQPGAQAPVFDTDNGALVGVLGSAYKIDTALLEATAPLLNLKGGTVLATSDNAIDLVNRAKVSIPNDAVSMVTLRSSALIVANGHLVNVAGGSVLNIAGNLVSLADGSSLSLLNGLLLNVSGGSSASIGRSLISFSGSNNVLNVSNSIRPTAVINGIPVSGPTDSFRIGANAIAGAGSGTIRINGVQLTPNTPLSSLTGSLVAVQGSGAVKVGQ
jgi:hypothetical protein